MKNFILFLPIVSILFFLSCGPQQPNTTWDFLNLESFQINTITSNSPYKMAFTVKGSVEESQTKLIDKLKESGFSPATKVHELMDYGDNILDWQVKKGLPFMELAEKSNFVKDKEGVKIAVYHSDFEGGTSIRLEKYVITNTEAVHEEAVKLRKLAFVGKYSLFERKYTNLYDFKGTDSIELAAFEPTFELLQNTLEIKLFEDETYEESFPFMTDDKVVILGNWKLSDDLWTITFMPADVSGNNFLDSYFIKNETESDLGTTASVLELNENRLVISTIKYMGVQVKSEFTKYSL
jgi:hypothetical protein